MLILLLKGHILWCEFHSPTSRMCYTFLRQTTDTGNFHLKHKSNEHHLTWLKNGS